MTADPTRRSLCLLGSISLGLYAAVLVLSFRFRYGEGHRERPILAVLGLLAAASVCYLLALRQVWSQKSATGDKEREAGRLGVVLLFAVLGRLVLLPSAPVQEIDYYRYLWDGRVATTGMNPYHFSPQQVDRFGNRAASDSELRALGRLAGASEAVATIFARVHHREVPTVYPPAAQVVFAVAATITPASAPLWAHVLVLKILLLAFDLGTLLLLVRLLRRLGLPACWCLAYGWCPLALKEFANSAHLDAIAIFFTTLALLLLVPRRQSVATGFQPVERIGRLKTCRHDGTLALAVLGLAVLAKSYPIILLPVVGAYVVARQRWRACAALAAFSAVVAVGYFLFWTPLTPPLPAGGRAQEPTRAHHPLQGLKTFLTRWQMNDLLFMLAQENLRCPGGQPERWFVVVPASWREAAHAHVLGGAPAEDLSFLAAQALLGLILAGLCTVWAWQVYRRPEPQRLLRAAFLTLAWGWLLASAQHPWYLLWCLPLMVFAGRRSWFLLPALALLYYLRFWLEYHALGDDTVRRAAKDVFDYGIVWVEFAPFFLALVAESLWTRRKLAPLPAGAVSSPQTEQTSPWASVPQA